MSDDPTKLITVTWKTLRDRSGAYVLEFTDGQLALTFGPMPNDKVDPLIAERRKHVADIFDRCLERLNNENPPQENQQVADPSLP